MKNTYVRWNTLLVKVKHTFDKWLNGCQRYNWLKYKKNIFLHNASYIKPIHKYFFSEISEKNNFKKWNESGKERKKERKKEREKETDVEKVRGNGNYLNENKTKLFFEKTDKEHNENNKFDKMLKLTETINQEEEQKIDFILNKLKNKKKDGFLLELIGISNGNDIIKASEMCVKNCEKIFENIFKENNILKIINMIDTASNNICKLGDALELLRNLHNNKDISVKANEGLQNIEAYIDRINIDKNVYMFLKKKFQEHKNILNKEHKEVLYNMILSMENQGVHIKDEIKKKQYLELQQSEKALTFFISSDNGFSFITSNGIYIEKKKLEKYIKKKLIEEYENKISHFILNKQIQWDANYSKDRYIYICNDSLMIRIILENINDGAITKKAYNLYKQPNEHFLQHILILHYYRNKLTQFRNFQSYNSYALKNCILNTPEKVNYFLRGFLEKLLPYFFKELEFIEKCIKMFEKRKLKEKENVSTQQVLDIHIPTKLTPENIHYYMNKIKKKKLKNIEDQMKKKLNLYDVIQFLIFLLKNVYSLEMNYVPIQKNEVWDNTILKFEIKKEENVYGYIYMDLFVRPNKNNSTAQYTVRSSKNMNMCLKYNWIEQNFENFPFFYSGIIKSKKDNEVSYRQITSTFLVCNFIPGQNENCASDMAEKENEDIDTNEWKDETLLGKQIKNILKKTEMSIEKTSNLLHEFGHTLHCILSSTYLQHLSGNRSGVDFSEFASHFFETYLNNSDSLLLLYSKGGKENQMNNIKPLLKEYIKNKNIICYYPLVQSTIQAIIDQIFYSISHNANSIIETKYLIEKEINTYFQGIYYKDIFILDLFPQTHFSKTTHLVEYPANYYSYLYCSVISSYVWNRSFEKNFFNKEKANKIVHFLTRGSIDSSLRGIISLIEDDEEKISFLSEQPHKIPLGPFFANYEQNKLDYDSFLENL